MRQLLGVGARAEAVRVMLTIDATRRDATRRDATRATSATIAKSAGYAKRNVQEALYALEQAGVLMTARGGYEQRHGIERARWAALLAVEEFPTHVESVQLLRGLRRTLSWLRHAADAELSNYMPASGARDLLETIRPDLEYADIVVPRGNSRATRCRTSSTSFSRLSTSCGKTRPSAAARLARCHSTSLPPLSGYNQSWSVARGLAADVQAAVRWAAANGPHAT